MERVGEAGRDPEFRSSWLDVIEFLSCLEGPVAQVARARP